MNMTRIVQCGLSALAVTACTTMGTAIGTTRSGDVRAILSWRSSNDRTGTMTAMLSNGEVYTGTYFQITGETRVDTLGTLWPGWDVGPVGLTGIRARNSSPITAGVLSPIW